MKTRLAYLHGLIVSLVLSALTPAQATWIEEEIPANLIKVTASSQFGDGQTARHLCEEKGLRNGRHDNDGSAQTMWHTAQNPPSTSPGRTCPRPRLGCALILPGRRPLIRFYLESQPSQSDGPGIPSDTNSWNSRRYDLVCPDFTGSDRIAARQRQSGSSERSRYEYRQGPLTPVGPHRGRTKGRKLRRAIILV